MEASAHSTLHFVILLPWGERAEAGVPLSGVVSSSPKFPVK